MNKLLFFLHNNRLVIILWILYICFRPTWEKLFAKWITAPFLSQFSSDWCTSLLFLIAFLGIIVYHIVSIRQKELHLNNKAVGISLLILFIWGYYRDPNTAVHLKLFSSLCYVDIIPFLCVHTCLNYGISRKKQSTPIISTDGFYIDQPITQAEQDLLDRATDAKDAVNKLLATNADNEAFTFGIIASWGEGKTSFMKLMEEYLLQKYKSGIIVMKFNPWIYRKESNLTNIFLDELSNKLESYSSRLSKGLTQYAKMLSTIDNGSIQFLTKLFISFSAKTTAEQYTLLKSEIKKINKKFIFFIDDIDRLNSNEMEEMLRLVRNTSNLPNMYFILAYDKKYVVDTLNTHYSTHSLKYLDKILQEEYELPPATGEQLKHIFLLTLKSQLNDNEYNQIEKFTNERPLLQINLFSFIKTIRAIKRIANQFVFSIRKLHGEVDLCDYLTLELFRLRYPFIVKLFIEKKDEILIYKQNLQKVVYFNGENAPQEDKTKNNILFKNKYFNLIEYITQHQKEFYINEHDIDKISEFLDALFGEYKSCNIGSINDPTYLNRFFRFSILDSEVSEKEWSELYKLPFEEMKPTIKEWTPNKYFSLTNRIQKENPKEKQDIYKLLHLSFYIGALSNEQIFYDFKFIDRLLQSLYAQSSDKGQFSEEDRKEMYACLTENGINHYQIHYLFSLFKHGSYRDDNIFTKDEIIKMQNNIFKQFLNEGNHTMNDIVDCWRDTAYQEFKPNGDGTGHIEYLHSKESTQLMKEYAMKHFEAFIPRIITYFRPNINSQYAVSEISIRLWDTWENFYDYVISIDNDSPVIAEFKEFISECKNHEFNHYVYFKFKHIKLEEN